MLWSDLLPPLHLHEIKDVAARPLSCVKKVNLLRGLHRTTENTTDKLLSCVPLNVRTEKLFLVPPVLDWDLTNQSVKL